MANYTEERHQALLNQAVFEAQVSARAEGVLEGAATENAACASICDNYDGTGTSPVAVNIGQLIRSRMVPSE